MSEESNGQLIPDDAALVLSVGTSPEPLKISLRRYRPRNVIFVASMDTAESIQDILSDTEGVVRSEIITLSDYQHLVTCVQEIRAELPAKLRAMKLKGNALLIGDITGGTKVMSAALALALMEFNSRFTYVGGSERSKTARGIVIGGKEEIIEMANPWDALGLREARDLAHAFNAGQFQAAREKADFLKAKLSDYSIFYDGLSSIIDAFRKWDMFDYVAAKGLFGQGMGKLRPYNNPHRPGFRTFFESLAKAQKALDVIAADASILQGPFRPLGAEIGQAYLADLLANARRCAKSGHYDDAVARLYSAVEKTFKIALARAGIDNSRVPLSLLEEKCPDLAKKYGPAALEEAGQKGAEPGAKLPMRDSYALLAAIAPEEHLATAYRRMEKALDKALTARNLSLLAHGYTPVGEDNYRKLSALACDLLNIKESELTDFPVLEYRNILF